MSDAETIEGAIDELTKNEITEEDVRLAARRAFTFLSACVEGQVSDAKVGDRIMAARSLLEHAARFPDLLGELATIADLASEEDVAVIVSALD